ncbi:restriction endonuclease subunit S [Anaerolactibacter massiliensis]|uniref:restriction endonuclease subunit S n=1 Tax=Anaerolactibacter massiliensis TaxID=2044573 RepID=UPI000CF97D4F|nr:restriction endonuclease subunit S [Anaerolactibacter massiliensis]
MSREMNSEYACFGAIPSNWDVKKIKSVFTLKSVKSGGVGELLSVYLDRGVISYSDSTGMQVHKPSQDLSNYQVVNNGDFVLNNQQAWRGSVGVSKYDGIISPAYVIYTMGKDCDPSYMGYLLRDKSMVQQYELSSRGVGTIQRNIFVPWLRESFVLIPPLSEQHRIADFLDSKCSQIDEISKKIQEEIDTLEEYKKSVITEAVTKGLDPNVEMKDSGYEWLGIMPVQWALQKGKYLFVQKNDRGNTINLQLLSPTQNYGVIPQSLYEELSGFNAVKLNDKTDFNQLKTVHKGAYVISLRSFQGGFEYSEYEGVVSPAYQVFYPVISIDDRYYKYFFKTQIFIDKMNSYTMSLRDGKNIAFADFGNTYIPYPPKNEQQKIADYLDDKTSRITASIDAKKSQLEVIEEYKKSLIYEYVTGKKEVA